MSFDKKEMEANMQLMLDSLEEDGLDVVAQALQTIASMCSETEAQDILREKDGLKAIFSLLKTTRHISIKQYAMFALACALTKNVHSQVVLCVPELFHFLRTVLHNTHELLKLKCVASFLINILVYNNTIGQKLARECNLLKPLMDIIRLEWDEKGSVLDVHSVSFNLHLSVCNALSAAVNNPQNVDNQRICSSLLSLLAEVLPTLTSSVQLSPVAVFLVSCVTNHFMIQERVRAVGLLKAAVDLALAQDLSVDDNLCVAVLLLDAMVHCSNTNKSNQDMLVVVQVIPTIIRVLECTKDTSSLVKALTCLQMLTADQTGGRKQVHECGGIPVLVQLLAESHDEDLKQVSLLILQSCLKQKTPFSDSDTSPDSADVAIDRLELLMKKFATYDQRVANVPPANRPDNRTTRSVSHGLHIRGGDIPVGSTCVGGNRGKQESLHREVQESDKQGKTSAGSTKYVTPGAEASATHPQTSNRVLSVDSMKIQHGSKNMNMNRLSFASTQQQPPSEVSKDLPSSNCVSLSSSGKLAQCSNDQNSLSLDPLADDCKLAHASIVGKVSETSTDAKNSHEQTGYTSRFTNRQTVLPCSEGNTNTSYTTSPVPSVMQKQAVTISNPTDITSNEHIKTSVHNHRTAKHVTKATTQTTTQATAQTVEQATIQATKQASVQATTRYKVHGTPVCASDNALGLDQGQERTLWKVPAVPKPYQALPNSLQGSGSGVGAALQPDHIIRDLEQLPEELLHLPRKHNKPKRNAPQQSTSLQGSVKRIRGSHHTDSESTPAYKIDRILFKPCSSTYRSNTLVPSIALRNNRHKNGSFVSNDTIRTNSSRAGTVSTPAGQKHILQQSPAREPRQLSQPSNRHPKCALCSSVVYGSTQCSNSRNLMKQVFNDPHTCPVHEAYAKQSFAAKCNHEKQLNSSACSSVLFSQSQGQPDGRSRRDMMHLPSPVTPVSSFATCSIYSVDDTPLLHPNHHQIRRTTIFTSALALTQPTTKICNYPDNQPQSSIHSSRHITSTCHSLSTPSKATVPERCAASKASALALKNSRRNQLPHTPRPWCSSPRSHSSAKRPRPTGKDSTRQLRTDQSHRLGAFKPTVQSVYDFSPPESTCSESESSRRKCVPFTAQEGKYILDGVRQYGTRWRLILDCYPFNPCRTQGDLKDKYRNLKAR